jgi:hypothetical protein
VARTQDYLEACLQLSEIPEHPVPAHDLDLFHSVAVIKVPEEASLGFGDEDADIRLLPDLERLNFSELPANTLFGWMRDRHKHRLWVSDEQGREVADRYFAYVGNEIRSRLPFMPSMFTVDAAAIRLDCLGYVMERMDVWPESGSPDGETGEPRAGAALQR